MTPFFFVGIYFVGIEKKKEKKKKRVEKQEQKQEQDLLLQMNPKNSDHLRKFQVSVSSPTLCEKRTNFQDRKNH